MDGKRLFISEDKKTIAMLILKGTDEIFCNGEKMKHVPVVKIDGKKIFVQVGSVAHPMTDAHLIQWIYLQTRKGGQYKHLTAEDKPEANFIIAEDDEPVAVYEYCNLHGLWKAEI